jgi:hypothetical protein
MHIPPEHVHVLLSRQRGRLGGSGSPGGGLGTGAIVGIVIGSIAGVLALALVVYACIRRRRAYRNGPQERRRQKEVSEDPLGSMANIGSIFRGGRR